MELRETIRRRIGEVEGQYNGGGEGNNRICNKLYLKVGELLGSSEGKKPLPCNVASYELIFKDNKDKQILLRDSLIFLHCGSDK